MSPATFKSVSSGIAQIRTFSCNGHALARGTGFLIGKSVAMTTRRMLSGACAARVTVNGHTLVGKSWAILAAKGVSDAATDLATIKLSANASGAHVFVLRSSSPSGGVSLAMAGYPAGTKLGAFPGQARVERQEGRRAVAGYSGCGRSRGGRRAADRRRRPRGRNRPGRPRRARRHREQGRVVEARSGAWWAPAKADLCMSMRRAASRAARARRRPRRRPPLRAIQRRAGRRARA